VLNVECDLVALGRALVDSVRDRVSLLWKLLWMLWRVVGKLANWPYHTLLDRRVTRTLRRSPITPTWDRSDSHMSSGVALGVGVLDDPLADRGSRRVTLWVWLVGVKRRLVENRYGALWSKVNRNTLWLIDDPVHLTLSDSWLNWSPS